MKNNIKVIIFDMDGTLYPYDSLDKKYKKHATDKEILDILQKEKNSKLDTSVFLSEYLNVNIETIYKEKMDIEPAEKLAINVMFQNFDIRKFEEKLLTEYSIHTKI